MHIIGLGEGAHHDDFLPGLFGHLLGHIGIEVGLTDGGAGGGIDALGEERARLLGGFHGFVVKLGMEQGIDIGGGDAQDSFLLADQTVR